MDYNKVINYGFNLFVEDTFDNDDVKRFLRSHERFPKLVENLARELQILDKSNFMSKGTNQSRRNTVKKLIKDFSLSFCKAALEDIANKKGIKTNDKNSLQI